MAAQILAYFSHSYRPEDREVNSFFWDLCSDSDYFFTVDPESKVFSIPYLESMMLRSNCFVAVIPRRATSPLGCSPYILFEYGLAMQARIPALMFVEQDVNSEWFGTDSEQVITFNRQRLEGHRPEFRRALKRLARRIRGERNPDLRLRRPCGLLLPASPETTAIYSPAVVQRLTVELRKYGRTLEIVPVDFDASFQFSLQLDRYDFLMTEVRDALGAPWLAGYVLGRAMPTIKLYHLQPGEDPTSVPVPSVVSRHRPQGTDEPALEFWRDPDELLQRVAVHVAKLNQARIEFHTKEAGVRYFSRAGRRDLEVFVSNAGISNPLAHDLVAQLRIESINYFHYQVKNAIPIGDRWLQTLECEIDSAGIFVAIIEPDYLQSQWCLYELQIARKRAADGQLKVLSYLLDPALMPLLPAVGLGEFQVRDCTGLSPEALVANIVSDLDRELRLGLPPAAPSSPIRSAISASLVLSEDERRQLVEVVAGRLTPEDATTRPAWVKGLLMRALLYASLAGEDYSGSAQTVATNLVTRTEALGVLADGERAIAKLVRALCDEGRVTQSAVPFLTGLVSRLQLGAGN